MRRFLVCDTGPLLHLGEAKILSPLHLAGDILIPSVVAEEFKRNSAAFKLPDWVILQELEDPYQKKCSIGGNRSMQGKQLPLR